jgi:hypothetical protein
MPVRGLTRDAQDTGDFSRLKDLATVEEGVDLTFSIGHSLNVTFQQ